MKSLNLGRGIERGIDEVQARMRALMMKISKQATLKKNDIKGRNMKTGSIRTTNTLDNKFRHKGNILRRYNSRVSLNKHFQEAIKV